MRVDVVFYVPWVGALLARGPVRPTGGAETQVFVLAQQLARRSLRVCLTAFAIPGTEIPSRAEGVNVVLRRPYSGGGGPIAKLAEVVATWQTLAAVRSSVIVTRAAGPHVGLCAIAAKVLRRRFVYAAANVSDFEPTVLLPTRVYRWLYELGVRLADAVVVQTEEQVELCAQTFRRDAVVIKNIVEPAPVADREPEAFLWVGRAIWYKRPLAYVDLARALPHATFWMIAVPGPGGDELHAEIAAAAAATPNLELLEPRPRDELMLMVDRAVAIVNTSDFEGMPNATLEGWARGVPALSLSHDPDGVIDRHDLGCFAHGSRDALSAGAERLWGARHARAELAERCRRYIAEHHHPDVIADQWTRVLRVAPASASPLPVVAEAS